MASEKNCCSVTTFLRICFASLSLVVFLVNVRLSAKQSFALQPPTDYDPSFTVDNGSSPIHDNNNNNNNNNNIATDGSSNRTEHLHDLVAMWNDKTGNGTVDSSSEGDAAARPSKTLSLLFPAGLLGGYRNQAMRFIGLLKHAVDERYDRILLPTLMFSTRFEASRRFWPIPFDELFDVDHWNSFHKKTAPGGGSEDVSLPRLVWSVEDDEIAAADDDGTPNRTVCWTPEPDRSVVSIAAIEAKSDGTEYNVSILPPLNHRMLFGEDDENDDDETRPRRRKSFLLDPVQAEAVRFLAGEDLARYVHKVDMMPLVENCTHPRVFGGKSKILWNSFLQINKMRRKRPALYRTYRKLIETVDEALVPARPWRLLADRCVEHHLGLSENEFRQEEEDPHARGHDHGYIALHARVEPEMLGHECGKYMERNLTTVLGLVDGLAEEHNALLEASSSADAARTTTTAAAGGSISGRLLRELLEGNTTAMRPLKGTFVAIAREEMANAQKYPKLMNLTLYNTDVLNARSISYDDSGGELYTASLAAKEKADRRQRRRLLLREPEPSPPAGESSPRRRLDVSFTLEKHGSFKLKKNDDSTTEKAFPVFECGEGWVKHAFYKSEARQRSLFTPPSSSSSSPVSEAGYGLYHKYGPREDGTPATNLPLPDRYFGDLLPSMMNFWLAVRADVFVGVRGSSWSTDVWTTRYYMGRGDRNFEYTADQGILAIGDGGLPPPHRNCKEANRQREGKKQKRKRRRGRR